MVDLRKVGVRRTGCQVLVAERPGMHVGWQVWQECQVVLAKRTIASGQHFANVRAYPALLLLRNARQDFL